MKEKLELKVDKRFTKQKHKWKGTLPVTESEHLRYTRLSKEVNEEGRLLHYSFINYLGSGLLGS